MPCRGSEFAAPSAVKAKMPPFPHNATGISVPKCANGGISKTSWAHAPEGPNVQTRQRLNVGRVWGLVLVAGFVILGRLFGHENFGGEHQSRDGGSVAQG
ncbi:hypothetical protein SAMN04489740_3812 [Arthrobacter alpinus]|uniref:Uncharacterized protein n=1 Tax=Arthrobacter alpinus TaxID=656366 RepID=A0A1H5NNN1_9MICC|nr:hypothetical protein SAMN04489740_3812 [Arthrobacter alpinus]